MFSYCLPPAIITDSHQHAKKVFVIRHGFIKEIYYDYMSVT